MARLKPWSFKTRFMQPVVQRKNKMSDAGVSIGHFVCGEMEGTC